ncbi:MAG TPA: tRNA (adenosine(37)-N6)-threonylcarbamoyltransferase complex ATPase subunit type 1 TsaE [Marmoricola sp.]|nr:tRNA (adenosine(37)-N6)-threonylcarbamoyltransferase complex ATPase subunit type 1 TsaE [Marmoricola sp.]
MTEGNLVVTEVGPDTAGEVLSVIHGAFGPRPVLDPPSTAMAETADSVAAALAHDGGLLARLDGRPVGALLLGRVEDSLLLTRVSVLPEHQSAGVARALSATADEVARRRGLARLHLTARVELPATVRFWESGGYREVRREGPLLTMAKELAVACEAPTAEATRELGRRLASVVRAGDVLLLSGDLGAGKTTFTQGLGAGLGVRGGVTSPTFVISRVHPSLVGGPALVHVDAYRLGGLAELDDLDLDVSVDDSVTVVEWGEGIAEGLADDRLEVAFTRSTGSSVEGSEQRTVRITPVGARWVGSDVARAVK